MKLDMKNQGFPQVFREQGGFFHRPKFEDDFWRVRQRYRGDLWGDKVLKKYRGDDKKWGGIPPPSPCRENPENVQRISDTSELNAPTI